MSKWLTNLSEEFVIWFSATYLLIYWNYFVSFYNFLNAADTFIHFCRYFRGLQKCVGLYNEKGQYTFDEIDRLDALYKSLREQYSWSSAVKVKYLYHFPPIQSTMVYLVLSYFYFSRSTLLIAFLDMVFEWCFLSCTIYFSLAWHYSGAAA